MEDWLLRTEMLIGKEKLEKIKNSTIAILGIGGVGSYVAESLVRCGIENIILIDSDTVNITNINRQLIADTSNLGKPKVEVAKERYLKINPKLNIITYYEFFDEKSCEKLISTDYNYIVDCIDTVKSKILLIKTSKEKNIPIISSMGTGNKLNPALFEISDIYETSVCPLAKVIRKGCKKQGIKNLKVVYSKEEPNKNDKKIATHASISFVPSVAGILLASEVVKDLIK